MNFDIVFILANVMAYKTDDVVENLRLDLVFIARYCAQATTHSQCVKIAFLVICTHTYVHDMYTYLHAYIGTYLRTVHPGHAYMHTCIHIGTYMYIYAYMKIYLHIYKKYAHIHIYIYTHIHTYIYANTQIYIYTLLHMYICTY